MCIETGVSVYKVEMSLEREGRLTMVIHLGEQNDCTAAIIK